jgi:hypothetical protein
VLALAGARSDQGFGPFTRQAIQMKSPRYSGKLWRIHFDFTRVYAILLAPDLSLQTVSFCFSDWTSFAGVASNPVVNATFERVE